MVSHLYSQVKLNYIDIRIKICYTKNSMVRLGSLLIFLIGYGFCSTEDARQATNYAINTTRKALMEVPVIRQVTQAAGEETLKYVGISKEEAAYIAPTMVAVQGRLTTKYFKGFRYKTSKWIFTPLIEYNFRYDSYRLEASLYIPF